MTTEYRGVALTMPQWERVMTVLGETGNDAIAGDIAIQLQLTTPMVMDHGMRHDVPAWTDMLATNERGQRLYHFDPNSTDNAENARGKMGWKGPYPMTPCQNCGAEWFLWNGDWSMGYRCEKCGRTWK